MFYCGLYGHVGAVKDGLLTYILDLTPNDCQNIHLNHAFNLYGNHLITGLKPNSTTEHATTLAGTIEPNNGDCQGTTYTQFGRTFEKVVVQATLKITLTDY